jgi:uncharacterized membrane protein YfcA
MLLQIPTTEIELEWYGYGLLILAGFAAGLVNTLAGSGSVFTLSTLIFFGLPTDIANGTNRIGTTLQTITAVWVFRKHEKNTFKWSLPFIIPSVLGAILGAFIAADLNEQTFRYVVGGIMFFLLLLIIFNPKKQLKNNEPSEQKKASWLHFILFFFIGVYGGFIQAGIGIMLLVSLVSLMGFDMVKANIVKVVVVFAFCFPVLLVFVLNDQVNWLMGGFLAIGQLLGSLLAAKFSLKNSNANKWIRVLLVVMILLTEAKIFGLFDLIGSWVG